MAEKLLPNELIDSGACADGAWVVAAPDAVVGVEDLLELLQAAAASAAAAATAPTDASFRVRVRDKALPRGWAIRPLGDGNVVSGVLTVSQHP
ncbi:MAG: hypothetical protein J2P57_04135 [Acidimicrobiaceae bacterium]|nr:hypothetical protein [Acidimicrobiaceae bacterium]